MGRLLSQTQCIGDATLGENCNSATTDTSLVFSTQVTGSRTDIAASSIILRPGFHVVAAPSLSYTAKIDTQFAQELIVYNDYDELGQLVRKKVGGTSGTTFATTTGNLQTVDYAYNIRGWLKNINQDAVADNDLFNFGIAYNEPQNGGTALYNGNISETSWRTANSDDSSQKHYRYSYDALNRITSATDNTSKFNVSNMAYDKNGNIATLRREGWTNANPSLANNTGFGTMDDLSYSYTGNQLMKVADAATIDQYGFRDDAVNTIADSTDDYLYDQNGNMVRDDNKEITNIEYNHLNLPEQVSFGSNNIQYVYSAHGAKLKKTVSTTGTETLYANGYIYEGSTLQFFPHPEGYVSFENGNYEYVYHYKDHLGNIRLSYKDISTSSTPNLEIQEENNYYPFGLQHKGYNNVVNGTEHKYKYQNKEIQEELGLNWYDFGARNFDQALGRWMNPDALAEDYSSYSPYNYALNNPIFFFDPDGNSVDTIYENINTGESVEVEDGIDKTIKVNDSDFQEAKFFANEINESTTTITIGGKEIEAKVINYVSDDIADAYTEFYNDHNSYDGFSLANASDYLFNSPKIKRQSDLVMSGGGAMDLIGGKKAIIPISRALGITAKVQKHHIIPKAIYKQYKSLLKPFMKLGGGFNLKKLPTPFHGNHPQYNKYVGKQIQGLINSGNLNSGSLGKLQKTLNSQLNKAYDSGMKLNDYFRQFN